MAGTTSSRETILAKIRRSLAQPVPLPFPKQETPGEIYPSATEDLTVAFAQEFTRLLGKFAYCSGREEWVHQIRELIVESGGKEVYCSDPTWRNLLSPDG